MDSTNPTCRIDLIHCTVLIRSTNYLLPKSHPNSNKLTNGSQKRGRGRRSTCHGVAIREAARRGERNTAGHRGLHVADRPSPRLGDSESWGPSSAAAVRWWCSVGRSTCGLEAPDYLWPSKFGRRRGERHLLGQRRSAVRASGPLVFTDFFFSVPTVKLDEALGWITVVPFRGWWRLQKAALGPNGLMGHPLVAASSRRFFALKKVEEFC